MSEKNSDRGLASAESELTKRGVKNRHHFVFQSVTNNKQNIITTLRPTPLTLVIFIQILFMHMACQTLSLDKINESAAKEEESRDEDSLSYNGGSKWVGKELIE